MNKHLLGDWVIRKLSFDKEERYLEEFSLQSFQNLYEHEKSEKISQALLLMIQNAPNNEFLIPSILSFIDRLYQKKTAMHYSMATFEMWLNQLSDLSAEENYKVRGKIAGKWIPRIDYQLLFPLTSGKLYSGSHIVTGHGSPDLDTTVASFWGWLDAFSARVSEHLHLWNVPGGPPACQVEVSLLFNNMLGPSSFNFLAKHRTNLALSGLDLVNQKKMVKKQLDESMHETADASQSVVIVDENGFFKGEWNPQDYENVQTVAALITHCLRWFGNYINICFLELFTQENLLRRDLDGFIQKLFSLQLCQWTPVLTFSLQQKHMLEQYLVQILDIQSGLNSSFNIISLATQKFGVCDLARVLKLIESLKSSDLFDDAGRLIENRTLIFKQIALILELADQEISKVQVFNERFDVALKIKTLVLKASLRHVNYQADLDEIHYKMEGYTSITVTVSDKNSRLYPLGVIQASQLHKSSLSTVSLRDFCNRDETRIPGYLDIISVVDHHKSQLATNSPATVIIGDVQSVNTLVATLSFNFSDNYSINGMCEKTIVSQLEEIQKDLSDSSKLRICQRLLKRLQVVRQNHGYFISPNREAIEYLHYLYAIIDDTDLLTKVSLKDVECVASLLNRLKSLMLGKEVEVIHFDRLAKDERFVKEAATCILQNEEMYSLYKQIYAAKEESVDQQILLTIEDKPSTIFADTKEQNGCCQVGQTKLFAKNIALYGMQSHLLQKKWFEAALNLSSQNKEVDLFIHMISTIAGADEMYAGQVLDYAHKDELWLWSPLSESGLAHLRSFLNAFSQAPHVLNNDLELEIQEDKEEVFLHIFRESFINIPICSVAKQLPLAILRFKAGSMNSRKSMISPYLPKI